MGLVSSSVASFSTLVEMPSGPAALDGFKFLSSFLTSSSVRMTCSNLGSSVFVIWGSGSCFLLQKTL